MSTQERNSDLIQNIELTEKENLELVNRHNIEVEELRHQYAVMQQDFEMQNVTIFFLFKTFFMLFFNVVLSLFGKSVCKQEKTVLRIRQWSKEIDPTVNRDLVKGLLGPILGLQINIILLCNV